MERSSSLMSSLPRQFRQRFSSPWRVPSQMEEDMLSMQNMKKWFDDGGLLPSGLYDGVDFIPHCELKETNQEYIARFDVPGVKKNELKIEVDGNRLTVRGERKSEKKETDERHYFAESAYGSFMRTFTLPFRIEEAKVDAHYEDGVLTIKIPKTEVSKAKEIAVY